MLSGSVVFSKWAIALSGTALLGVELVLVEVLLEAGDSALVGAVRIEADGV